MQGSKVIHATISTGTLTLNGIELDCAVIADADGKPVRVLSRNKLQAAFGLVRNGRKIAQEANGLPYFVADSNLKVLVPKELLELAAPLFYREPHRGLLAAGYRADLLPRICTLYITAYRDGVLTAAQEALFWRSLEIQNAFAVLGINALVDEATGYQEQREKDALQRLIEAYLGEKPLAWVRTFPHEYYQEAYRVLGLRYTPGNTRHPMRVAQFTKAAIYDALPPGVYQALCARNPRVHGPRSSWRPHKHHQWMTEEVGRSHVLGRLQIVLHLLRLSRTPGHFFRLLDGGKPRLSQLVLFDEPAPLGRAQEDDDAR